MTSVNGIFRERKEICKLLLPHILLRLIRGVKKSATEPPDNMTVFCNQKESSYAKNHRLVWHSVCMTLLPIPKGVILSGRLCIGRRRSFLIILFLRCFLKSPNEMATHTCTPVLSEQMWWDVSSLRGFGVLYSGIAQRGRPSKKINKS